MQLGLLEQLGKDVQKIVRRVERQRRTHLERIVERLSNPDKLFRDSGGASYTVRWSDPAGWPEQDLHQLRKTVLLGWGEWVCKEIDGMIEAREKDPAQTSRVRSLRVTASRFRTALGMILRDSHVCPKALRSQIMACSRLHATGDKLQLRRLMALIGFAEKFGFVGERGNPSFRHEARGMTPTIGRRYGRIFGFAYRE